MKEFLTFEMDVFKGWELADYNIDMESWLETPPNERDSTLEPIPPKGYLSEIDIDPLEIVSYHASFSRFEAYNHPKKPLLDNTTIMLKNGDTTQVNVTIDKFREQYKAFFANKIST